MLRTAITDVIRLSVLSSIPSLDVKSNTNVETKHGLKIAHVIQDIVKKSFKTKAVTGSALQNMNQTTSARNGYESGSKRPVLGTRTKMFFLTKKNKSGGNIQHRYRMQRSTLTPYIFKSATSKFTFKNLILSPILSTCRTTARNGASQINTGPLAG